MRAGTTLLLLFNVILFVACFPPPLAVPMRESLAIEGWIVVEKLVSKNQEVFVRFIWARRHVITILPPLVAKKSVDVLVFVGNVAVIKFK